MTISKKKSEILKAVRAVKGVQAVFDDGDILCCVSLTMLRQDQVDSGSMRVNIPNYYSFSHMVWLMVGKTMTPEQEMTAEFWGKVGASYFVVNSPEQAVDVISNIPKVISVTRECPKNTYLVD